MKYDFESIIDRRGKDALAVDGLGMLACQGVLGFELWTGVTPSLEVMENVLKQEFAE